MNVWGFANKSIIQFWYPILDRFRTKYYEVIVNLAKEIDMAQRSLGLITLLHS